MRDYDKELVKRKVFEYIRFIVVAIIIGVVIIIGLNYLYSGYGLLEF